MKERPLTEEDIAYIKANFTYDPETGAVTRWGRFQRRGRTGSYGSGGYLKFSKCNGRGTALAHRIALVLSGHDVNGMQVDHINGNTRDNRLVNLRLVSQKDNLRNSKKSSRNASGVTGVYWSPQCQKWRVKIGIGKRSRQSHLGYFNDFFEAVCARKSADNRLGYHPNHGRR